MQKSSPFRVLRNPSRNAGRTNGGINKKARLTAPAFFILSMACPMGLAADNWVRRRRPPRPNGDFLQNRGAFF